MTTPTTVQVQIQLRADTAANWTSTDPTLLANEVGRETDTGKIKIGDGTTAWNSLAYQPFGAEITDADIAANAEIAVSKLANGAANQVLVTDGTDVSWSDDLTLAGNLTVNGTTTTIDTETLVVKDKNIELAVVDSPDDTTADGGGITLKGATDKTITWSNTTDAWTSNQVLDVPAGSAAAPSLIFNADVNSGIYSPGADQVAISTSGTGRLFVDASGNVEVLNTAGPIFRLNRNDATISSGDSLGAVQFYDADGGGTGPGVTASIEALGASIYGASDLLFKTSTSSGGNRGTLDERLRITADAYVRLASGTGGIQFNGDTAAANALDDYEEGTWTPVVADASTGGNTGTFTASSATYTKIGRLVTLSLSLSAINTAGMTGANDFFVRGLPFAMLSDPSVVALAVGSVTGNFITSASPLTAEILDGTSYLRLTEFVSGAAVDRVTVSEINSGTASLYLTMTYETAS